MDAQKLILLRDKLRNQKDVDLIIILDNLKIMEESKDMVVWDDENELLYSMGLNANHLNARSYPALFTATSYEHVQFLQLGCKTEVARELVTRIKTGANIVINRPAMETHIFDLFKKDEQSFL